MRKKYLSALLFGALLFASAGTFTSCKDYDDDINNLSQRIDQVASDLNDLKTKVDALGGYVENVSFADGVLSVTTGGNTVTYNIPDKTGVNEVTLALEGNNLVLTVDGTATTIELPAAESGETPEIPEIEVIDGVLYINGEAQDLKVDVESNVTIIESTIPGNETYTVMVNGEEVTFAKAFADVRISLTGKGTGYFTEIGADEYYSQSYGIHWARATKDIAWDGPKGNIASGTLVVGQTTAAEVTVRPINFDLKAHENELTLVSSTGAVAPAKVVVYKSQDNGPLHSGSRAADITYDDVKQGDYVLGIQLNSDLTDRQVIESFATADGNHNIKYALALDGTVVTDYVFAIDTQLKADTQTKCEDVVWNNFVIGGKDYWEAPTGTHQMTYLDGRIYDMKVEIDPSSQSDANVYGVKINEDGTITAAESAQNRQFKLQVTLIDVNGNISETEVITVTFKKQEAAQVTELAPMPYTITPAADKSVIINLGDVFTSLSDEDAIAIRNKGNIEWTIENNDNTFVLPLSAFGASLDNAITYYEDAACTQEIDASDMFNGEAVKSIKYAKIPVSAYSNIAATLGEHLLSITLNRQVGVPGTTVDKTIKKVNVPVDVQLPAWEDIFKTTTQWNGNTYVARLTNVDRSLNNAEISMDAFEDASTAWGSNINDDIRIEAMKYIGADGREYNAAWGMPAQVGTQTANLNYSALTADINTTHKLAFTELTAKAVYEFGVPNFKIEKEFTVQLKSIFEDAKLVYYVWNGSAWVANANAKMNAADVIPVGAVDPVNNSTITAEGLVLELNNYKAEVSGWMLQPGNVKNLKANNIAGGQFNIETRLGALNTGAEEDIYVYNTEAQASGLTGASIDNTNTSGINVVGTAGTIESGNGGSITLQFVDNMGVYTEASINFVKQ